MAMNQFYKTKKDLFDIAGNVINSEKYPFINVLNSYLTDIVASIDMEIKNTSRNISINWKEKKNPKLLSRFINNDENINNINRSVNKVTGNNYLDIITEINESLVEDSTNKISDYSKYIFDCVIKKCMVEESFTGDYIKFLCAFKNNIGKHITTMLKNFEYNTMSIMDNSSGIKNNTYFDIIQDIIQYKNVGIFMGKLAVEGFTNGEELSKYFMLNIESLINLFDWQPVNMDDIMVRMYLAIGILESCHDKLLFKYFNEKNINIINNCFDMVYGYNGMNTKIKFKILDMKDLIKQKIVHIKKSATPATSATPIKTLSEPALASTSTSTTLYIIPNLQTSKSPLILLPQRIQNLNQYKSNNHNMNIIGTIKQKPTKPQQQQPQQQPQQPQQQPPLQQRPPHCRRYCMHTAATFPDRL